MNNSKATIEKILSERIMIIDGAMGTMIQTYKLTEEDYRGERFKDFPHSIKGNNDLLVLTRPDVVAAIHKEFLEAGADIIETNTFNAQAISMADYHMEDLVYEINFEAAKIAKQVATEVTATNPNKPRFVAGAIGPTTKTASLSPDVNNPGYRAVTFNDLVQAYSKQINALLDGGVDLLLVETIFDTLNAKAALFAIDEVFGELNVELPIMVSGTITDQSGRTLTGQTTEAFLISVSHMPLLTVGLNCALGASMMRPYLQVLNTKCEFGVSAHPNAGLPNEFGKYDETPEMMGTQIKEFLDEGLINIIGGCCGTTPEHIKVIADLAKNYSPRKIA